MRGTTVGTMAGTMTTSLTVIVVVLLITGTTIIVVVVVLAETCGGATQKRCRIAKVVAGGRCTVDVAQEDADDWALGVSGGRSRGRGRGRGIACTVCNMVVVDEFGGRGIAVVGRSKGVVREVAAHSGRVAAVAIVADLRTLVARGRGRGKSIVIVAVD